MANHKSALKRIRQSELRSLRNKYDHKSTRTAIKNLKAESYKEAASSQLCITSSMIDKLAKRNIIHQNKASRLKSQLAKKVNQLAHEG
ncbi:MAG: 30S ribosomal protein S20 [Flavobacteriales bacterium Tduv]